ncbi:MAG TPA: spore coat U domain-containing protein [Thermodesulfovibrionales bacterium]|nr:spore coat U domain-containing protein [Thermodesulfovibrionales bacterium]
MKREFFVLGLTIIVFVCAGIAGADQRTSNLQVSANVVSYCTVSTSAVDFGSVTGESTTLANGDVTVNCPLETTYHIALDWGRNSYGMSRIAAGGGHNVDYWLFKDGSHSVQWGDSDYGNTYTYGSSLADTGNGSDQSHPVYGMLDVFSGLPTGTTLGDTVTATVYY